MLSWYAHTTKTTMVPRSPRGATGWVDPNEEPELISQLEGIVRKLDDPKPRGTRFITEEIISITGANKNALTGERVMCPPIRNTNVVFGGGEVVLQGTCLLLAGDAVQLGQLINPATVNSEEKILMLVLRCNRFLRVGGSQSLLCSARVHESH